MHEVYKMAAFAMEVRTKGPMDIKYDKSWKKGLVKMFLRFLFLYTMEKLWILQL